MNFLNEPQSYVTILPNGEIHVTGDSVPEVKLALKELKLKKKAYSLTKREVMQKQRAIRASYTEQVRQQGSKFRGGGGIGSFVRTVQTISRDTARRQLANELAPLEQQKANIERIVAAIEQVLLQVESYIIKNS